MKTLRRKFILFAMAAVTVLLLLLIVSINGLNLYLTTQQEKRIVEMLVNADGNLRLIDFITNPQPALPIFQNPDKDKMQSTRFFIVRLDKSGEVSEIILDRIFSVSPNQAEEYAMSIMSKGLSSGMIDRFRYVVKHKEDKTELYFVDCSQQGENVKIIFYISGLIAAVSWLLVLIFVILISGKVVRPILEGYEKQKQFITDAGHELKTPMAIIQSNNDAMTLIHGENKYNRNIKTQVIRLNQLTAELLMLAKYDENNEFQKEIIDINELTGEILPVYRDTAEARGVKFVAKIVPDLSYSSHRESLTKLFTILLDNAVKYTSDSGVIEFEIAKRGNHIIVTEQNTCDPVSDKNTERLFERFYRGDSARTQDDNNSGYGIGLSMARRIAENLGGTLKADYISDETIRFTAEL